ENMWDKVASLSKEMDLVIVQSATDALSPFKAFAKKLTTKLPKIEKSDKIISCKEFAMHGLGTKAAEAEYVGDAAAFVVRTGGTTGISKGVVLTNDSINAVSANFTQCGMKREKGESLLNFLPIAASYGIVCGMHMALTMGFTNILIPVFNPDDFADLVAKHKPNHIIGVPVFYEKLMNSPRVQKMDLSFIKTMAAGGDSLNLALLERLHEFCNDHKVPYPMAQGYGMSEVSSAASFGVQFIHKAGSVGIPSVYTTIGIFDPETGEELPYNKTGEVCISGPTLMKEYLNEPEETANIMKLHDDGKLWVHSGDLGRIDEDGFLFIEGRMKRTIVRFDGHKSYPIQIETVVCERTDVLNCCVIPVKDLDHPQGELPLIVAEVNKGKDFDEDVLRKEILEYCKENIESRSWPVSVVFVDDIPISANSKNDYKALIKEYGAYKYK
ncbi:MAG: class I adenylate-forming enzyme family protein, partial [Prevotellaceae bacterium]|nr:class I adenylate-forming enzyme family protein [Prevotellaceae bacterium]